MIFNLTALALMILKDCTDKEKKDENIDFECCQEIKILKRTKDSPAKLSIIMNCVLLRPFNNHDASCHPCAY